jgi:1-acyl-sn-glycerol-3-phosphate acyltransferase
MTFEQTVDRALEIINDGLKKNKNNELNAEKSKDKKEDKVEESAFYNAFYSLFAGFFRFFLRLRPTGLENIPKEHGCIVCANHVSLLDVFSISACFPKSRRLRYLAKAELFRIPVLRSIIVALGGCRLERKGTDIAAMKKAISLAKNGEAVAIFPQGTRCKGKNPADTTPKNGLGMIAYHTKAPIIPVCIKTNKQKYCLFRRVEIIVGEPIYYDQLGFVRGGKDEYAAATDIAFKKICELGGFSPSAKESL